MQRFDQNCAATSLYYTWSRKVKFSRYRPGVVQRVGRGIALIFHDRGTRRGWVVSSTSRSHFTPGKDPILIVQEAGWVQSRTGRAENLVPTGIRSQTVEPVVQSLYRLSYRAHIYTWRNKWKITTKLTQLLVHKVYTKQWTTLVYLQAFVIKQYSKIRNKWRILRIMLFVHMPWKQGWGGNYLFFMLALHGSESSAPNFGRFTLEKKIPDSVCTPKWREKSLSFTENRKRIHQPLCR